MFSPKSMSNLGRLTVSFSKKRSFQKIRVYLSSRQERGDTNPRDKRNGKGQKERKKTKRQKERREC